MAVCLQQKLLYHKRPVSTDGRETAPAPEADVDAALVARAQAGDMQAFEDLVRQYRNQVYALSFHFVKNREEAWDISQEVFIKAYRSMNQFRGEASFKSWLLRITSNQCKDFLKKRRLSTVPFEEAVRADVASGFMGPSAQVEATELGVAIDKAIAALPVKHRTAILLREFQGMSYQEMAQAMECNVGTVMSRLHHARKKLQEALIGMGVVEDRN